MKTPLNVRVAAKVSRLVLVGLRLLQRWSCIVLECMAWKQTHPCSQDAFKRAGGDPLGKGMEYERVVRYNWSKQELSAIVEVRDQSRGWLWMTLVELWAFFVTTKPCSRLRNPF